MKIIIENPELLAEFSLLGPIPVRKRCCRRCPANTPPNDPESLDISGAVRSGETHYLSVAYRCFMDTKRLCRGQYNLCHGGDKSARNTSENLSG